MGRLINGILYFSSKDTVFHFSRGFLPPEPFEKGIQAVVALLFICFLSRRMNTTAVEERTEKIITENTI